MSQIIGKKCTKLPFNRYIPVFEVVQFIDGDQDFDKSRLEKSKDHMFPSTESNSHGFSITIDNWLQMAAGKSQFSAKIEIAVLILKVPFDFCLLVPCKIDNDRIFDSRYIIWDSCGISGRPYKPKSQLSIQRILGFNLIRFWHGRE